MDRGNDGRQAENDQKAGWTFSSQDAGGSQKTTPHQESATDGGMVEWTASEYVAHEKSASWYIQVLLVTAIVAAIAYFITRDTVSTVVMIFAGIIFAVAGARKPRVLAYRVDHGGLTIGQKYHPFGQFKAYAVMNEGTFVTVVFMPMKRFLPTIDIHLPPQNANEIIKVISNSLPVVNRQQGIVDTFSHRIRF